LSHKSGSKKRNFKGKGIKLSRDPQDFAGFIEHRGQLSPACHKKSLRSKKILIRKKIFQKIVPGQTSKIIPSEDHPFLWIACDSRSNDESQVGKEHLAFRKNSIQIIPGILSGRSQDEFHESLVKEVDPASKGRSIIRDTSRPGFQPKTKSLRRVTSAGIKSKVLCFLGDKIGAFEEKKEK